MTPTADGGSLAAETLRAHGVEVVFTLSGGHLFPLYDGCVRENVRLVDTRHEQTATFAAEGWAKVTRGVGVAALTAGPGVTNGLSAMAAAQMTGAPVTVIGGRAPAMRWGQGSLQEFDHVPVVGPVTKLAMTTNGSEAIPGDLDRVLRAALTPHRGPTFLDVPLDAWGPVEAAPLGSPDPASLRAAPADPDDVARVAALVAESERPVLMIGADVYWDGADEAVRAFADAAGIPVFANGLGRGVVPADHPLAFSRARRDAFKSADLVLVAGTPLDFRLSFGNFGQARVVHLCDCAGSVAGHVELAASTAGDLRATFASLHDALSRGRRVDHDHWLDELRRVEHAARDGDADLLTADTDPIKPTRVYGELLARLDRDAIVIGDGGDFVSYAGTYVDTYSPGCFLDPGPFGCLGNGPGYALAAALAHPDRQVVLLYGDGAVGFSLADLDSLVRHGVNVVAIIGNNGIWGLEKHPMELIFGYSVVADLRPGTRYDLVAEALGASGELVDAPVQLGPALDRAFGQPGLSVVNVLTDPADAYPRSANLG